MEKYNDLINETTNSPIFDPPPPPPQLPPYPCAGTEAAGSVELINPDGTVSNAILASRCFADWFCSFMPYTWRWRDGIDPDDPTTWPLSPPEPTEPPQEP